MTTVLCSSVSSNRSFLGLGLSITSILTWIAFITAAIMAVIIYANASRVANNYNRYNYNGNGNWYYNGNNNQNGEGGSADRVGQMYQLLASATSSSLIFVSIYAACLSMVVTIYGSQRVVGNMNLTGKYVSPSFNNGENAQLNSKHFGIFLGAMAMLANIFLVVAVVFGEFQIGGIEARRMEEVGFFAIEKIAAVLGSIFFSLSFMYFVYSFLLFSYKDQITMEETEDQTGNENYVSPQAVMA